MQAASKRTPASFHFRQPVILAALLVYFLALERDRVTTYFAADDMMNLAFNMFLAFRLALALAASRFVAGLAALLVAYHAGLPNLHYNVDMIYDVLCFTFFIGGLLLYVSIRKRGGFARWYEIAAFLVRYLCALNSKEMALQLK